MRMKTCTKCEVGKDESEFPPRKGKLGAQCRLCVNDAARAWRRANPEKTQEASRRWREANPDKAKEACRRWLEANSDRVKRQYANWYAEKKSEKRLAHSAWRERNEDRVKAYGRFWRRENAAHCRARNANRHAAKLRATPKWANLDAIAEIYATAAQVGCHVDHVVPLRSQLVCGLHCEANLQALPRADNLSKGNRWWPDMP